MGKKTSSTTSIDFNERELLRAYDEYADALFRHCYFRLYNRESAKDVVQDTYMKTWEYLSSGNSIDTMRAFLYRVANNLIIDHIRKQRSLSLEMLHEKGFNPHDTSKDARVGDIVSGREIVRMLDKLEEPYRAVVVMRYIDDLMPREIAAVLGETENAISVRIHRATQKIKYLWEQGDIHDA